MGRRRAKRVGVGGEEPWPPRAAASAAAAAQMEEETRGDASSQARRVGAIAAAKELDPRRMRRMGGGELVELAFSLGRSVAEEASAARAAPTPAEELERMQAVLVLLLAQRACSALAAARCAESGVAPQADEEGRGGGPTVAQ